MANDLAISVRGVSKKYRIQHNAQHATTLAEALVSRLKNPIQRPQYETFWAVRDVSFDVMKGDVVGVVGRNGAGKSTLLKILSRITTPTSGEIDLYGRLGSLLEVGTGFHPELTGRENVYLNGQILGMARKEIDRQFDAIVDFADIEQFLDTPVKRYSSGMYVRLAFAVAAHLNPEILIIDEVLAVGDAAFQKKCLGKMESVSESGRTILFVSHNMVAIQNLCKKCVYLQKGVVQAYGPTDEILARYVSDSEQATKGRISERTDRDGNGDVRCTDLILRNTSGDVIQFVYPNEPFQIEVVYDCKKRPNDLRAAIDIDTSDGVRVTSLCSIFMNQIFKADPGTGRLFCHVPGLQLRPDTYNIQIVLHTENLAYDILRKAAPLEVKEADVYGSGRLPERMQGPMLSRFSWSESGMSERTTASLGWKASEMQEV
jgi:lipopolysaccharide transport system ATP-binding protein